LIYSLSGEHMTSWWNKNLPGERLEEFKSWVEKDLQTDRVYCRKYIAEKLYESILDCGCGMATDYYGFKEENYPINYAGLDSCTYLIELHRSNGIPMIDAELDNPLPVAEDSYDCVYGREIMEHLQYHRRALDEFIRIAKKEVIISWFIKPDHKPEDIRYRRDEDIFHNKYNIDQLQNFILSNDKVESFTWVEPNDKHVVLHIMLKNRGPRLSVEERDGIIELERIASMTQEDVIKWETLTNEEKEAERARWAALTEQEREAERVRKANGIVEPNPTDDARLAAELEVTPEVVESEATPEPVVEPESDKTE